MAPSICWFRNDLRLDDQPAWRGACERGEPVIALVVWDPEAEGAWSPGGASRWWLHRSLQALDASLQSLGGRLVIRIGASEAVLAEVAAATGADTVYANERFEPAVRASDARVQRALSERGVGIVWSNGSLLHDPWSLRTGTGVPYKVYTPFSKAWRARCRLDAPRGAPRQVPWFTGDIGSEPIDALGLQPSIPWDRGFHDLWTPGEAGAKERLKAFLAGPVSDYAEGRDVPAKPAASRLSPHLHHGEVSPRRVWHEAERAVTAHPAWRQAIDKFQAELLWRDFAHHVLANFPHTAERPLQPAFEAFPWANDPVKLKAWQRGRTGYPIVDAGMRELWATGTMHNRVRMVVSSFLVKHLRQHWRNGADWFWDTLLDADLSSNTLGWQWSAGCGADAAPYFRIFNPVLQGEKFDADGTYVRRWVPELARVPAKLIHKPWEAPTAVLEAAGVTLGEHYPRPIVDHAAARDAALAALSSIKASAS
jgi:deoxyribodipyrimidine photo-lyase